MFQGSRQFENSQRFFVKILKDDELKTNKDRFRSFIKHKSVKKNKKNNWR